MPHVLKPTLINGRSLATCSKLCHACAMLTLLDLVFEGVLLSLSRSIDLKFTRCYAEKGYLSMYSFLNTIQVLRLAYTSYINMDEHKYILFVYSLVLKTTVTTDHPQPAIFSQRKRSSVKEDTMYVDTYITSS